jgi:hypothetical protein
LAGYGSLNQALINQTEYAQDVLYLSFMCLHVVKLNVHFVDVQGIGKLSWGENLQYHEEQIITAMIMFGGMFYCPDPMYVALFQEWFLPQLKCDVQDMWFQDVIVPEYLNEVSLM